MERWKFILKWNKYHKLIKIINIIFKIMEIKKEEFYEFEIERRGAVNDNLESIDDPLRACIKIKLKKIPERNEKDEKILVATSHQKRVLRFKEKKQIEKHNYCSSDSESNLVSENNKSRIQSWRKRKRELESLEESEARRFRARIMTIKSRLIAKLELPDSELEARRQRDVKLNVLRRNKRLAKQTPEEIAARKVSQATQARWKRNCLEATESPEETAQRKTKERENIRNYRAMRLANESEKERSVRKERERRDRERFKQRKLEKSRQLNTVESTVQDQ